MDDEAMKQYRSQFTREQLTPTNDRLKMEAAGAAGTLAHVWDGEVEVLVVMVRKGAKEVQWAISGTEDRERLLHFLRCIWDSSAFMKALIKRDLGVK